MIFCPGSERFVLVEVVEVFYGGAGANAPPGQRLAALLARIDVPRLVEPRRVTSRRGGEEGRRAAGVVVPGVTWSWVVWFVPSRGRGCDKGNS